jgi:hypothetical protein
MDLAISVIRPGAIGRIDSSQQVDPGDQLLMLMIHVGDPGTQVGAPFNGLHDNLPHVAAVIGK